jgi:hypothetical protein
MRPVVAREHYVLMVDSPAEVGATVTYRDGWSTTA